MRTTPRPITGRPADMDDQMIDSIAGDGILGRRLEAYAELRLTPDLATSSRLRARVLAVAHRQASLVRGDAGLTVLPRPADNAAARSRGGVRPDTRHAATRPQRQRWYRVAGVLLAASLGSLLVAGAALAARPGGPLYESRLWAETIGLPVDPSARAVAELDRLRERLSEIGEASRSGDSAGATAALAAYEAIIEEASASAILADDEVAAAVLETGVGRNVEVLQSLLGRVPANASDAISRAIDAAIARSAEAIDRIDASRPGGGEPPARGGDGGTSGGGSAAEPTPRATKVPAEKPTKAPVTAATPKPKPTDRGTSQPAKPRAPDPTPERTPKPKPNQAKPPGPPPQNGGGNAEHESD